MGKFRKIMLVALSTVMAVSTACFVAACTSNVTFADFINPSSPVTPPGPGDGEFRGDYKISVKSAGGLSINGVKVTATKNGETVAEGISVNGLVEFMLDPAEYTLTVDESTLPTGYFVPEGATYTTAADKGEATITVTSTIIPTTAVSGTRYSMGDIMYDFSFTDTKSGRHYTLSDIFAEKKAIVLNFFYTTCRPCQSEFPAMETAYSRYSDDIEIIALTNHGESTDEINKFKQDYNITFLMAQDQSGIHNLFGVQSWPVTVIIDRFGAIAYWDSTGAITEVSTWSSLFARFTDPEYSQPDIGGGEEITDWVKPDADIVMPSSSEIEQAVNGSGANGKVNNYRLGESKDAQEESWPWLLGDDGDGKYLYSPNVGKNYSYSTLYVDFNLESGDIVSFDYKINSEADCDYLRVLLVDLDDASNNKLLASYSGDSTGWTTVSALYTANRPIKITLCFTYLKDQMKGPAAGEEIAALKNIRIIKASDIKTATDSVTPAVSGNIGSDGKYEAYANVKLNPADGYYHLYDEATDTYGALLLADILADTMWSSHIVGKSTFVNPENKTTVASLYHMSYWTMSNYKTAQSDGGLVFTYDRTPDKSLSNNLISYYYLQSFSDNGYAPVTEDLKTILSTFAKAYCDANDKEYYDEQWLEFCYYFIHYGEDHEEGEDCYVTADPILGMTKFNAHTAVESTAGNLVANHVNVTKINIEDGGGGQFFKFKPQHSGVYHFTTTTTSNTIDPLIMVRTERGDINASLVAELDDDMSPDKFLHPGYNNVDGYVYLTAGETYYLQCRFHQLQSTGQYDLYVQYTGSDSIEYLRFATTGEGMWTYNDKMYYYIAIPVALGADNKYHALNRDGSLGSLIYIDFVHPQYYDTNDHSLLDIINEGYFDFRESGGKDYTASMLNLYNNSVVGKDKDDELYGLVEATKALVTILSNYLEMRHGEPLETGYWLSFACYYQHIGR